MVHMLHKQILPACMDFSGKLAQNVAVKKSIGVDSPEETQLVRTLTESTATLSALTVDSGTAPAKGARGNPARFPLLLRPDPPRYGARQGKLPTGWKCW